CQWGTQRRAMREGRDYRWMAAHYYPGATVLEPAQPEPTWAASLPEPPTPLELVAGAGATVVLDVVNSGTAPWDASHELVTTRPSGRESPLRTPAWRSGSEVASVIAAPGAKVRVTIPLRAPRVSAAASFTESFAIARGDQAVGPDPLVTLELSVRPSSSTTPPGNPHDDATGGCQAASGASGAGAWLLAGLLGLRLTRALRAPPRRCGRAGRRRGRPTGRA